MITSAELSGPKAGFYGPEPGAPGTALERAAFDAVRAAHPGERLRFSASLAVAARELAHRAARGEPLPVGGSRLRAALAAGLAFDPAPAALLVSASPARDAPAAVARAVAPGRATRIGIGMAVQGDTAHAVVLLARRRAALRPFPRDVARGARAILHGALVDLVSPRIFVTLPSGEALEVGRSRDRSFDASLSFDQPGRYLVEVVGTGPSGPEVAALLAVSCDGASLSTPAEPAAAGEPDSVADAETQVVAAINATRARRHLPPLRASAPVAAAARRHSERMREAGLLAHVLPGSGDAGERLRTARVPYRRVLENVALAPTSLTAHQTAEESPAHLRNLLDPGAVEVGCGIARGRLPGGSSGVYLTEIFVEPPQPEAEGRLAPEGLVREALWRERERLGRPSLLSDSRLDELARETAWAMLQRDDPSGDSSRSRAVTLGRKVTAIDAFVAASPAEAARSSNLADSQFRRVGVGVAVGDSPRFGAGRLWIAVIYTD